MTANEIVTDSKPSETINKHAQKGLDITDAMPGPLRECVHVYGFAVVHAFREAGIKEPRLIHHLVNEVREGGRQPNQRTGKNNSPVMQKLDWLLVQRGAQITAAELIRTLWRNSMVIVPVSASNQMVQASIDATGNMGLVSKTEKHSGRLQAAIRAAVVQFWPHLLER